MDIEKITDPEYIHSLWNESISSIIFIVVFGFGIIVCSIFHPYVNLSPTVLTINEDLEYGMNEQLNITLLDVTHCELHEFIYTITINIESNTYNCCTIQLTSEKYNTIQYYTIITNRNTTIHVNSGFYYIQTEWDGSSHFTRFSIEVVSTPSVKDEITFYGFYFMFIICILSFVLVIVAFILLSHECVMIGKEFERLKLEERLKLDNKVKQLAQSRLESEIQDEMLNELNDSEYYKVK